MKLRLALFISLAGFIANSDLALSFQDNQQTAAERWEDRRHTILLMHQIVGAAGENVTGIKDELEVVDSQLNELQKVFSDFRKKLQEIGSAQRKVILQLNQEGATAEEIAATKAKWLEDSAIDFLWLSDEVEEEVVEILLPHQLKRFNHLVYQKLLLVKAKGDQTMVLYELAKELELSDKELVEFKKRMIELRQDYIDDIKKLKQKYDRSVMELFPGRTAPRVNELIGEIYEFTQQGN